MVERVVNGNVNYVDGIKRAAVLNYGDSLVFQFDGGAEDRASFVLAVIEGLQEQGCDFIVNSGAHGNFRHDPRLDEDTVPDDGLYLLGRERGSVHPGYINRVVVKGDIHVQALIVPVDDGDDNYVAYTTFAPVGPEMMGRGRDLEEVMGSAMNIVFRSTKSQADKGWPLYVPETQLHGVEAVVAHFDESIPEGASVVGGERRETRYEGLPRIVIDFYRAEL